jgi:hypothetical protein
MDPSEYKPHPVDTSSIELDQDLRGSLEALAQNNHEVWAQARAAEGWKYGPERNDARMEHPGLVPYEQLSEAEKDIDRETVIQTLKAATALGLDIRRRGAAEHSSSLPSREKSRPQKDDMADWPAWPEGISADALAELEKVRETIDGIYQSANKSATVNLGWHRIVASSVAILGSAALFMAIFRLYASEELLAKHHLESVSGWLEGLEFVFVSSAFVLVIAGLWKRFMRKWLVQRHCAERCRFLKFNFLLEVGSSGRDRARLMRSARKFKEQADALEDMEYDDLEQWLEEDHVLRNAPPLHKNDPADLRVLAEDYLETRLAAQSRYFYRLAGRDVRAGWWLRRLPAYLFMTSIFVVLVHFLNDKYKLLPALEVAGGVLVLLAVVLPVLGASVRSVFAPWEYSRNALRFKAKHSALVLLIKDLEDKLAEQPNALELQTLLWKGEQILEGEHREWLRLMMETEWIG